MTERIHDDEPDTGEPVVRTLLATECPQWAHLPVDYLATSGTSNAMWRVRNDTGPDLVVRLPRRPEAAADVLWEAEVLTQLERAPIGPLVRTPVVRHLGGPHDVFAYNWSILEWIPGRDAWTCRRELEERPMDDLGRDLAAVVTAIGSLEIDGAPERRPGSRGGPLLPLLDRLDQWLDTPELGADQHMNVNAVRHLAAESRNVADEPVTTGFVHGDLIPGNLLVGHGRLAAVIDWGGAGHGDTAQDLAPAWAVLAEPERAAFKEAVGADEAAWLRGRAFELEHAVGGLLYYRPRGHPLADVMARTLERILDASHPARYHS